MAGTYFTVDLKDLPNYSSIFPSLGDYTLTVKAEAAGYLDSEASNSETYSIRQQLDAPITSLNADGYTLEFNAVPNAASYTLYVNGSARTVGISPSLGSFNLKALTLQTGSYSIQLRSIGSGYYLDSNLSTAVTYNAVSVYTITFANTTHYDVTKTDGTPLPNPFEIEDGGYASFKITAKPGYVCGDTSAHMFSISGAQVRTYTPIAGHGYTGVSLENATANVTITLVNTVAYTVTGNITNGTLVTTGYISPYQGDLCGFSITPDAGYEYPLAADLSATNVLVTNYNASTGEGYVGNASGNVVITAVCKKQLEEPSLSINGDTLTLTAGDTDTTSFDVYANDTFKVNVPV